MATTRQIPQADWQAYFDRFSKDVLGYLVPVEAMVEVISDELGAQKAAEHVRLVGITFDPRDDVLEIATEGYDHLIPHPDRIWCVEEDGFVSAMEVDRTDGTREVIRFLRVGIQRTGG
jgi:hypothetical protein